MFLFIRQETTIVTPGLARTNDKRNIKERTSDRNVNTKVAEPCREEAEVAIHSDALAFR